MRNVVKLFLVALVAVMCVDALATTSASAEEPLFVTESGKALLFVADGLGAVTLRGKKAGVEGTITCEKESVHGLALDKSTLARELHIEYNGKCEQTVGTNKGSCTEPIKPVLSYGELGLLKEHVLLLVAPEKGTEFVEVKCTNGNTKIGGAVIGEFKLNGRNGNSQYAVKQKAFLLLFKANGVKQEQEEIELLGSLMKGVALKAEGFFGEGASEEAVQLLLFAAGAAILPGKIFAFNPPRVLKFKAAGEKLPVGVENVTLFNLMVTKAELNVETYFKIPMGGDECKGVTLEGWLGIGQKVCSVKIDTPGVFVLGEKAILTITSTRGNEPYEVKTE
jgi:hypothetical protein